MAADYLVTLVHGTWADTRGWVAPGSLLRSELEQRLGTVVFREFSWNSRNTHAARAEAGVRLARFIRAGHAQCPGARHFIIAHSHGGNVALYAMRDEAARQAVAGIVTLATPFIRTRRRVLSRYVHVITWLLIAMPIVLGSVMFYDSRSAFLLLVACGAFAMARLESPLAKWLIDVARTEQADIVAAAEPPGIDPSMLLILSSARDEARGWLRVWDVAAQAPFVIAAVLLFVVGPLSRTPLYRRLGEISVFGVDGWTIAMALIAACLLLPVVLTFSGLMRWPGYGREPLRTNLLVAIRSERTPRAPGAEPHTIYTFDVPWPSGPDTNIRRRLRHKAICNNPSVVAAIADWIGQGTRPAAHQVRP